MLLQNTYKKHKAFIKAFYVLVSIVAMMFIVSFFNWKERDFSAIVLMPVFFVPMVLVNYLNLEKINKEFGFRKEV